MFLGEGVIVVMAFICKLYLRLEGRVCVSPLYPEDGVHQLHHEGRAVLSAALSSGLQQCCSTLLGMSLKVILGTVGHTVL